ncbi:hypothetical protein D3C87_1781680 [compost metagenome]
MCKSGKLGSTQHQWLEVETVSVFYLAAMSAMSVALAVRAVATMDETGFDQGRKMTPQGRAGNAMGTNRKLRIRRKDDKPVAGRKFVLRMEGQQRI